MAKKAPAPPKDQIFALASSGPAKILGPLLVLFDTSPDIRDRYGVTPLMLAARAGRLDCVKLFVKRGADVNARDKEGNTVLMHACAEGASSRTVAYLLSASAQVNGRNNYHSTALMLAACGGDDTIVKLLLAHGADPEVVSANQETALTFAIVWEHFKVVKALVDAGADIHWQDDHGWTPLHYAIFGKNGTIVNFLQERGAQAPLLSGLAPRRRVANKAAKRIVKTDR